MFLVVSGNLKEESDHKRCSDVLLFDFVAMSGARRGVH